MMRTKTIYTNISGLSWRLDASVLYADIRRHIERVVKTAIFRSVRSAKAFVLQLADSVCVWLKYAPSNHDSTDCVPDACGVNKTKKKHRQHQYTILDLFVVWVFFWFCLHCSVCWFHC